MVEITNPDWRALRLENQASVDYLNRMFRAGWFLEILNVDGLHVLVFEVALTPPAWTTPRSTHAHVDSNRIPVMPIVILRRGEQRNLQRAIVLERDTTGHFDFGAIPHSEQQWGHVTNFKLEDGNMVVIQQRGLTFSAVMKLGRR